MTVTPDDGELEIQWGNRKGPYRGGLFRVGQASVVAHSAQIRGILDALTAWKLSNAVDADVLSGLLQDLANSGYRLHYSLFDAKKIGPRTELLDWIRKSFDAGDTELAIKTDPDLDIPWGLVWDAKPDKSSTSRVGRKDFPHFWCHKFRLSTVFSDAGDVETTIGRDSFRIVSVLNKATFDSLPAVMEADQYRGFLEVVTKKKVGSVFKLDEFEDAIETATHRDTLVHFFGHATNKELDLGNETIDVTRFKMLLDGLAEDHGLGEARSLVFLNACDTGSGDLDHTFRAAAARKGYSGFIGTEAKVPKSFAALFGHELLRSIIDDGQSVGEALAKLREDNRLWPLSLLYCCYAPPDYKVECSHAVPDPLERI